MCLPVLKAEAKQDKLYFMGIYGAYISPLHRQELATRCSDTTHNPPQTENMAIKRNGKIVTFVILA